MPKLHGDILTAIAELGFPLTAAALRERQAARAAGLCVCGHAEEDHGPSGACEVDGCLCACWETYEDEDESEG